MNLKEYFTLLVLTAALPKVTEAFLFRNLRDVVRNIGEAISTYIKPVCQSACPKVCPQLGDYIGLPGEITQVGCHIGCQKLCKRSIPDFVMSDVRYRVVPMSKDFNHYDLNGDKLITPEEFSRAEKLPLEEVYDIFKFADVDGDNMLDMDEFETAPFVFTDTMAARINNMIQENNDKISTAKANPTKLSSSDMEVARDVNNANISLAETMRSNITLDTDDMA
ncbi:hypothetical protein CHS0354_029586 [Potamilus streckersoni]|uniref:EF-hand domain-containing protein n=1 Tax=Potamilus streckersoni TaxID=2493646 RepID=A0AAE0RTB5_9BIVA|nr:hypothetical protein CHS0354_029586 [Potamilus streckersoni]